MAPSRRQGSREHEKNLRLDAKIRSQTAALVGPPLGPSLMTLQLLL
jgi:hypothetical protein